MAQQMSREQYEAHMAQADEQLAALAVLAGKPMIGYWPDMNQRGEELMAYLHQGKSASVWDYELAA